MHFYSRLTQTTYGHLETTVYTNKHTHNQNLICPTVSPAAHNWEYERSNPYLRQSRSVSLNTHQLRQTLVFKCGAWIRMPNAEGFKCSHSALMSQLFIIFVELVILASRALRICRPVCVFVRVCACKWRCVQCASHAYLTIMGPMLTVNCFTGTLNI